MAKFSSDKLSTYYLSQLCKKRHKERKMKVAFAVRDPSNFSKELPVFEELAKRDDTELYIIVTPVISSTYANSKEGKVIQRVGFCNDEMWQFHKFYADKFNAKITAFTNLTDLRKLNLDYIFYLLPYETSRPFEYFRSDEVVKFTKICYIPYGYNGTVSFLQKEVNEREFLRNLYFYFSSCAETAEEHKKTYKSNVMMGYQHFLDLGYPMTEQFFNLKKEPSENKSILWNPRWSYDPKEGGSHFFEYKDKFIALRDKYPNAKLGMRPHPNMFHGFLSDGKMSYSDVQAYRQKLVEKNISYDDCQVLSKQTMTLLESAKNTDILIADFSSTIIMYFASGCPIIYCEHNFEYLKDYAEMMKGIYIAKNWNDVERYLDDLMNGIDPLKEQREKIRENFRRRQVGAAKRIVNCLVEDFRKSQI